MNKFFEGEEITLHSSSTFFLGKTVTTVLASDEDDSRTNNGTFDLTIKSVTPTPDNVQFYIQQQKDVNQQQQLFGHVHFNGCLNYEVRN